MKAGDSFKLDAKWWRDNKPKTMLKSSGLGKALDAFAKAEGAFNQSLSSAGKTFSKKPYEAFTTAMKALEEVDKCRLLAIKNAGKFHKETVEALKKDKTIKARTDLMRKMMADKVIAPHVKEVLDKQNRMEEAFKKFEERRKFQMKNNWKKVAAGDKDAIKRFGTTVADITAGLDRLDTDQVRLGANEVGGAIGRMPGDWSGHTKATSEVAKAAMRLNKEARELKRWTKDYAKYLRD